jgi:SUMO ligase MMS21 Smc5/6 complex component
MSNSEINKNMFKTLNNNTGIALETMDTVCGNRILRTWRECKTKSHLVCEKQLPMKRLKRDSIFESKPLMKIGGIS